MIYPKKIVSSQQIYNQRTMATLKRELASLQQINDQYPKYILTLDEDPTADYNGIKRINALIWLMGEIELNQKKVWK